MTTLDQIPRDHLIEMLKEAAWSTGGRRWFGDKQGYSLDVQEETCLTAVLYRKEKLYDTPEEAIVACWTRHYGDKP